MKDARFFWLEVYIKGGVMYFKDSVELWNASSFFNRNDDIFSCFRVYNINWYEINRREMFFVFQNILQPKIITGDLVFDINIEFKAHPYQNIHWINTRVFLHFDKINTPSLNNTRQMSVSWCSKITRAAEQSFDAAFYVVLNWQHLFKV